MIGATLKYIREKKDFSAKEVAWNIVSSAQLSRIENKNQMPAIDSFIKLLYRLNVSFDEFCLLSDNEHAKARVETKNYIEVILRVKNKQQLETAIAKMNNYYKIYGDPYFNHMRCLLKATLVLSKTKYNYSEALDALRPISDYLSSVETWFTYEIDLFTNCIYLYPLEKAIKIGDEALKNIKENYPLEEADVPTSKLLLNLAIYSLSNEAYYSHAHHYANTVLSLPRSKNILYYPLLAKFVNQVAYYKLKSTKYDEVYLVSLLNVLKLMEFDDLHEEFVNFLITHGIVLDNNLIASNTSKKQ